MRPKLVIENFIKGDNVPEVPEIEIQNGIFYKHHPIHRNRMQGESQWSIALTAERDCFRRTLEEHWILNNNAGWGLHFENNALTYLGVGRDHITPVFIAKFVDRNRSSIWHGYPADYRCDENDVPPHEVLKKWYETGIIPDAKVRKIMGRQPCKP
ncbi:MAG: hypothetical protein ABSB95_05470 [Dissulfurispiraceae bacterium]|jgi:hypothetical protein